MNTLSSLSIASMTLAGMLFSSLASPRTFAQAPNPQTAVQNVVTVFSVRWNTLNNNTAETGAFGDKKLELQQAYNAFIGISLVGCPDDFKASYRQFLATFETLLNILDERGSSDFEEFGIIFKNIQSGEPDGGAFRINREIRAASRELSVALQDFADLSVSKYGAIWATPAQTANETPRRIGAPNSMASANALTAIVADPDGWTNLRELPTTSSLALEKVENGQRVTILEYSQNWRKVRTQSGRTGFMYNRNIRETQ